MYNKVKYANETTSIFQLTVITSVIVIVLAIADIIALHRSLIGIISKIPILLFVTIVLYFGRKVQVSHIENLRIHRLTVERGSRYEGRIISINTHENYDSSNGTSTTLSSLTAEYYYPNENTMKTINSEILAQTTINVVGKKCVIYEYKGVAIIHEVEDITAKRMSEKEWGLLVIVILAFAIALWFCLK